MVQRIAKETLAWCAELRGRVDVLCGGFPCQDISIANINAPGISGSRSGLWKAMLGAVCLVRPKYVVVENVAALLEALKAVCKAFWAEAEDDDGVIYHNGHACTIMQQPLDQARAAIAKVEGTKND